MGSSSGLLPTPAPRPWRYLLQQDLFNPDIDRLLEHVKRAILTGWRAQVAQLLQSALQIHDWRLIIWDVMGESIYQRVQSFSELAGPCIPSRAPAHPVGSAACAVARPACLRHERLLPTPPAR